MLQRRAVTSCLTLLSAPFLARSQSPVPALRIGVLIPLSGPASLFGPSSRNCSLLAAEEINARGGLAGRQIALDFIDVGAGPEAAQRSAQQAWKSRGAVAMIGMHDSAVRASLVQTFRGAVPYIYTPTYEGGECAPGTYVLGETPSQQLQPVIPWLSRQRSVKRWYLIGNDYNWPRDTNRAAKEYIAQAGGTVVGEEYVPFAAASFDKQLANIRSVAADGVLITLVGGDSVAFNRAFAAQRLDSKVLRLGTLIEENTLAGIGAQSSSNLYATSGYFASILTKEARGFSERYMGRFGADAPALNVLAQSCYEGLMLLEALTVRARVVDARKFEEVAQWLVFSGPRGTTVLHNRHAIRDIYVAQADGTKFNVVKTFEAVRSGEGCKVSS